MGYFHLYIRRIPINMGITMLSKNLRKRLAKRIVWSMNMKEGESLRIGGGTHTQDLIEEISIQSMKHGVDTSFSTSSDEFTKRVYDEVPIKHLKRTPKLSMKMLEALDNSIRVESPKDPRIMEKISHEKIAAVREGSTPLRKKMDKFNIKWCFVGFPSEELAKKLGIKFSLLKRFIFDGILINQKALDKKARFILNGLKNAKSAHIFDEYGTNLTLRLGNRKLLVADGYMSNADIKMGDVGLNLPDGEVFTTPIETKGEGVLISPKRTDVFTGKMIEDIKLVFENGKLNMNKTTAEKNEMTMKNTIKNCMKIDAKNEKVVRTTNFAELGIGLNPIINQIIGYLLTDEKIGGTIHVAIGDNHNKAYGGKSSSCLHWDFVTNIGVNMEVTYRNNKTRVILQDGKICY